jgi:hypothetical protein
MDETSATSAQTGEASQPRIATPPKPTTFLRLGYAVRQWVIGVPDDWERISTEVKARQGLLKECAKSLGEVFPDDRQLCITLATTDIFVEKAQLHLTRRARHKYVLAVIFSILSLALLGAFLVAAWQRLDEFQWSQYHGIHWPETLLFLTLKIAASGVCFAAIYFCAALTRAFLHEATILLNRRHAIRFGRLIVYLSRGQGLDIKTVMDAFGWNLETRSAFLGLKPDVMSRGMLGQIGDVIERSIRAARGTDHR